MRVNPIFGTASFSSCYKNGNVDRERKEMNERARNPNPVSVGLGLDAHDDVTRFSRISQNPKKALWQPVSSPLIALGKTRISPFFKADISN